MVNSSLQTELNRFFQTIKDKYLYLDGVSTAAFCKARKKFSYTAFSALNTCLGDTFYDSAYVQRWNGFRLLAVDGSTSTLPNNKVLLDYFGKTCQHANYPSARLSQLYDVLNKLSVDMQISPMSTGERTLAAKHLVSVNALKDLVLYDRGYPAFWLFALHLQLNIHFCARASVDFSSVIREFLASGKKDALVELKASRASVKECQERSLSSSPLNVRLVRVELESGETEVLVTSLLDQKKFPRKAFLNLYHQRWFIEEDYKLMKSRLQVENFSGLSVEAIQQDIHAKILTKNIAAIAILEAEVLAKEKYQHRKLKYKINFTSVLSQLKNNIIRFVLHLSQPDLLAMFIEKIAVDVNAFDRRRKCDRNMEKISTKKHNTAYKNV